MEVSGMLASSQSQFSTDSSKKRCKTMDGLATTVSAYSACSTHGVYVSYSENTPMVQNESASTGQRSAPSPKTSNVSQPPQNIPKPGRMQRRRSSFGSDRLRVTTPKRKSKPPSSSSQSHHDFAPTHVVVAASSYSTQQLMPSRSSSYDEMDTTLQPQGTGLTTLAARTQSSSSWGTDEDYDSQPKTPRARPEVDSPAATAMQRQSTGGSVSTSYSDLFCASASCGGSSIAADDDDFSRAMSPVAMYSHEGPPAPPSTPASAGTATATSRRVIKDLGLATPLPSSSFFVKNVHQLEQRRMEQQQQQSLLLDDGSETPAPPRPVAVEAQFGPIPTEDTKTVPSTAASSAHTTTTTTTTAATSEHSNDFTEWAVGDRYQMLRMLGQGSYGQVAQALDLYQGRIDAYVAIKRIQSPFDQQVDAIRLFRELYILRRMRGNECIIQLLDVVQPPSEDLEEFHDLYLVFEYVDTDLYKLIMSPQYLSTEHIQTFLYQMLCGLKYIHSANVIHRGKIEMDILFENFV
jgi:hypothetical protein